MTASDAEVVPIRAAAPAPVEDADAEVAFVEGEDDDELGFVTTETVDVRGAIDPPAVAPDLALWSPWDTKNRRIVVPVWAKSWKAFRAWVVVNLREAGCFVTWHGTRLLPFYLPRLIRDASRGLWKVCSRSISYLWDVPSLHMAGDAKFHGKHDEFHKARKEWHRTAGPRLRNALIAAVPLSGLSLWAIVVTPTWALWTSGAVLMGPLAWLGHDPEKPLVDGYHVNSTNRLVKLNSLIILRALGGLGLSKLDNALKEGHPSYGSIVFRSPIERDGDAGYAVTIELPAGVTAGDVIERRERLASGLRCSLGRVWPEVVKGGHPGLVRLFVGDRDMNEIDQGPWPLAVKGKADLFGRVPFGTDQRGRPVWITLMFASGVIGAVPRVGKTFCLRILLLIAALDPRCKVFAFDKKGSGDLSPLTHVAHAYSVGDEDDVVERDVAIMRGIQRDMQRRYKVIRSLPKDRCPETKVTPELCTDPSLGLGPVFIGCDEIHYWFEHKKYGEEFVEICTDLVKRGPAAGIMFWGATQRPDAKSIPTKIRDNAIMRFCLKVMSWQPNDDCLGSGMHKAGVRSTIFSIDDKGVGYLVGDGADAQIVKTFKIDAVLAEKVALRAKAMRKRAGLLTGQAAGEDEEIEESPSLADDLPRVFVTAERLHSDDIITALQELRPGTYDGWSKNTLTAACRDQLGLKPKSTRIGETVLTGLERAAVLDAVAAHQARQLPRAGQTA